MKNNIHDYIGVQSLTIVEAMKKIDKNSLGLIYIVDENSKLVGCLTDGDIRRWLIRSGTTEGDVSLAMNYNPRYLHLEDKHYAKEKMNCEQIYSIAIINESREIVDIVIDDRILAIKTRQRKDVLNDTPIIIMAGGKGTRLYPFTKILPKPLIPIGDIPILERILTRFYQFGAREFFITINYRKEMIKSYFSELNTPYTIHFIEEDKPMGTAGSISLIEKEFEKPVIVTNCDILIEADYEEVLSYHNDSDNDMTIVSALKNISIPYGVLHSEKSGVIVGMEEKPELSYFINTGMYVVNPSILKLIPNDSLFHMTDLANKVIQLQKRLGMFPISENSFLDMGQFEEMKKMEERVANGYLN